MRDSSDPLLGPLSNSFPKPTYPMGSNPSFMDLLRPGATTNQSSPASKARMEFEQGNTDLAMQFADGVIMAGDRRQL